MTDAVEKSLTFHGPRGSRAAFVRTARIRSNQKELGQIRTGKIMSDGKIENLCVDGLPVDEHPDVYKDVESGAIYVTKVFRPPLGMNQEATMKVSYDLVEAFEKNREALNHYVAHETDRLRMRIQLRREKQCHAARVYLRYGGQIHERLADPLVSSEGTQLDFEKIAPELGQEYRVEWDW